MRKIERLLTEYGESHQNPTNKAIHWICVPVIFTSIAGLFWSIPSDGLRFILGSGPFVNWATVVAILAVIYYLTISIPLAFGMALFTFIVLWVLRLVELYVPLEVWLVSLIAFVLAWIGQFYGHQVEGKKPSFFKDLQFLLVGPAWLMHFLFKKAGIPY